MARCAVIDNFGCSLSWLARLQDEGWDVRWWIAPRSHKTIGDGIIPKAGSFAELCLWAKEGMNRGEETLVLVASSGLGEQADLMRTWGLPVIGGGSFCDKLENDRSFGQEIAQGVGIALPPFEEYPSLDACLQRCDDLGDLPVFFKSDSYIHSDATHGAESGAAMAEYLRDLQRQHPVRGSCLLQQKIDGTPFSTGRWWNGLSWVGPYEFTYEDKKFMNDGIGPSTGCSLNAVWFEENPEMAQRLNWEHLTYAFRRESAPPGLYDINAIVTPDGEAFFLEHTSRLGFDSEPTSMRLIPNLGEHLWAVANGREPALPSSDLAYSVRLSVPPYPSEFVAKNDDASPDGGSVRGTDGLWEGGFIGYQLRADDEGEYCVAGPEGIVGLALAVGDDIHKQHDEAMDTAKSLRVAGLQYRTDGAQRCEEAAKALKKAGVQVHPGLLGARVTTEA